VAPAKPTTPRKRYNPHEQGARVERRGRYWTVDLRPWDGARYTALRNPEHPLWPNGGERTEDEDIARRWSWRYVDARQDAKRAGLLGVVARPKRLQAATDEWLRHRERTVAYNTYSSSRTAARHLVAHMGKDAPTDDVLPATLQELFDGLIDAGYAPETLVTYRHALGAFCDWLGHGDANAARAVELPEPGEDDIEPPSDADIQAIRAAADTVDRNRRGRLPSARFAVETALAMGLRQQELFAAEWDRIDPHACTIRISRQLVKDGAGFKALKGKRGRTVLILPFWWAFYDRERSGLLLANADGSVIGSQSRAQRDLVRRVFDTAGVGAAGRGWHWLRHGYARLCLEQYDVRMEELQVFLGHADIGITQRSYGHLSEHRAARNARERMYGERRMLRAVAGGAS
jgi:integrase